MGQGGGGGLGVRGGGVRVDVNGELKFLGKFTKKKKFRWGGGGEGSGGGGQVGGLVGGGQGGCERRIEVFGKIQKPEDQWSCKRSPDILDVNVMLGVGGDVGYGEWEGVRFGGGGGGVRWGFGLVGGQVGCECYVGGRG